MPFFTIFCFKSVKLPQNLEIKISVWINLMPGPVQEDVSKKIKGTIEFKSTPEQEIDLSEVYILKQKKKLRIDFEKNKKNYYILKNFPVLEPEQEIDFLIRFKYKNRGFEKKIKKIKVGAVY